MNRWGMLTLALAAVGCEEPGVPVSPTITVGRIAACSLDASAVLRCWGGYEFATPAEWTGSEDPSRLYVVPPLDIPGGAVHADAAEHLCAVTRDGEVWCWGDGPEIGLSDGRPQRPTSTAVGDRFARVAVGRDRTCGITFEGGELWCWGENYRGRLGYGHREDIGDDEHPSTAGPLGLSAPVLDVALASASTCALIDGGDVVCWGYDEVAADAPSIDLPGPAAQITAGSRHTCARLEDGGVTCWGEAAGGRLGYGDLFPGCEGCESDPSCCVGDDETPAERGLVALGGAVVDIDAGDDHTCAVLETGAVRCWGEHSEGALGLGRIEVIGDDETPADVEPVDVGGAAVKVAAGGKQTCAQLEDGIIRCWGRAQRWDGTTGAVCYIQVSDPDDGSHGSGTTSEFSCEVAPHCCIGDDEPPSVARPVPL